MSADITKHTGVLYQYDPPVCFVVLDYEEPDSCFHFYLKDERCTAVHISPSLIEAAIQQIEKDKA